MGLSSVGDNNSMQLETITEDDEDIDLTSLMNEAELEEA